MSVLSGFFPDIICHLKLKENKEDYKELQGNKEDLKSYRKRRRFNIKELQENKEDLEKKCCHRKSRKNKDHRTSFAIS
jgi:hypothetical protein